jgi:CIC family chloride channel protein
MVFGHDPVEIGAFALVGMGAVFAGIVRAPITSVLIIFEMTGGYGLVLPLMIANMTAYALARRIRPTPIYDALLAQDGIHLPHGRTAASHVLEQLTVSTAMTQTLASLPAGDTVARAAELTRDLGHSAYPVVEPDGRFVGVLSRARMRRLLAEGKGAMPAGAVADPDSYVYATDRLTRAVVRMNKQGVRQLAAIDRDSRTLAGIVSMSDAMRAQATALAAADDPDVSIVPHPIGVRGPNR